MYEKNNGTVKFWPADHYPLRRRRSYFVSESIQDRFPNLFIITWSPHIVRMIRHLCDVTSEPLIRIGIGGGSSLKKDYLINRRLLNGATSVSTGYFILKSCAKIRGNNCSVNGEVCRLFKGLRKGLEVYHYSLDSGIATR